MKIKEQEMKDLLKDFKTTKVIDLKEIIQVDGGFFYITKSHILDCNKREYHTYKLNRVVSPNKMRILLGALGEKEK